MIWCGRGEEAVGEGECEREGERQMDKKWIKDRKSVYKCACSYHCHNNNILTFFMS